LHKGEFNIADCTASSSGINWKNPQKGELMAQSEIPSQNLPDTKNRSLDFKSNVSEYKMQLRLQEDFTHNTAVGEDAA
jgi:hypothetical protein